MRGIVKVTLSESSDLAIVVNNIYKISQFWLPTLRSLKLVWAGKKPHEDLGQNKNAFGDPTKILQPLLTASAKHKLGSIIVAQDSSAGGKRPIMTVKKATRNA